MSGQLYLFFKVGEGFLGDDHLASEETAFNSFIQTSIYRARQCSRCWRHRNEQHSLSP